MSCKEAQSDVHLFARSFVVLVHLHMRRNG
jgi:hypothetical protein